MTFTADQKKLLEADLIRSNVRTRKMAGRNVSYIEGWKAIAEANRIFGFDGWTREAVEVNCVSEKERKIGTDQNPGWGVTYICRVRIVAGDVVRDGCGAGHGIDRDIGQAHESAIKEAETDAMKRALMTFGNPFGLALYDKEQANVSDESPRDKFTGSCISVISAFTDEAKLREWWASEEQKSARRDFELTQEQIASLLEHIKIRIEEIKK